MYYKLFPFKVDTSKKVFAESEKKEEVDTTSEFSQARQAALAEALEAKSKVTKTFTQLVILSYITLLVFMYEFLISNSLKPTIDKSQLGGEQTMAQAQNPSHLHPRMSAPPVSVPVATSSRPAEPEPNRKSRNTISEIYKICIDFQLYRKNHM